MAPAYVESLGASVSDQAVVDAAVKKSELNSETLSGIAHSGKQVNLYSALDTRKTLEKVAQHRLTVWWGSRSLPWRGRIASMMP
ncbi:hypothetical protein [Sodalis glossinidius]|uniref:hypothetical protein n=1 Tax=Sodalis glossinidius TaxID=63612 RepID=UPI00068299E2|nr:hypothetical protein [Sodalis glossinidius]